MRVSLGEISKLVDGQLKGNRDLIIENIFIDSRKYFFPRASLFVALSGERNDGHDFIAGLLKSGLNCFLGERIPADLPGSDFSCILVKDSLSALHTIASWYREFFHSPVVGITGSNGKTIVKEWIYQAIGNEKNIVRSPQSYNSQVGVPLSLFLLEDKYSMALIEAGISKPGEMENLVKMIKPDIGIVTNIGEAHQENFSSLREKIKEKLKLFKGSGTIIYCADYKQLDEEARKSFTEERLVTWGNSGNCRYIIRSEIFDEGSVISFQGKETGKIKTAFKDSASIENLIHVMVFLYEQGFPLSFIQEQLKELEPVSMRMEILRGTNNCTIINDSYNSDLVSLSNALDYLQLQVQHNKKTLIISDIYQSGMTDKELYTRVAGMIAERRIDHVVTIGENITNYRELFPSQTAFYPNTDDFLNNISSFHFNDETILLKGARKFEFERISSYLQESSHRTVLEIDLNALLENYRFYRSLLKPGVGIMAMVKAFSYGSGGFEIANLLEYQNVEYLAVAYTDEGVNLRRHGIRTPIMVMNPETNEFPVIVKYNLEPEIYSMRILDEFSAYLEKNAIDSYPVHLKVDTGMHRLGFMPEDNNGVLVKKISKGLVKIVSVFSHLAASDEEIHDEFSRHQVKLFTDFCDGIQHALGYTFLRHILNTAGVERFPEAQFDMVRPGIGLYGVSSYNSGNIKEISTFKTRVAQIKEVFDYDTVGYSRAGKTGKYAKIATVPVGYADGIPRSVGNGIGKFMINHHLAPVIGNVCMDMCMLDVTGIQVSEGDEVIIFGKAHSVNKLAGYASTIPYEILTGISRRVKRIYYQE